MTRRPVRIIAEAGVNHNGSLDLALQLVDAAAAAGADVVKFQTFKAEHLASALAPKAVYQTVTTLADESQLDMLRRLELSREAHEHIVTRCAERRICFLSTPFDLESLDFLVSRTQVPEIKLGSGELTNAPLLLAAARTGKPVMLSTGMGTMAEVREALGVLAFGYAATTGAPSRAGFKDAYEDGTARSLLERNVTLLHCTTEYPAPDEDANLCAMDALKDEFGLKVGFSDHTNGFTIAVAAAARGACVIEKHFTLDRKLDGPDHKASLEPSELKAMVTAIRRVEVALGDGVKIPRPSEIENIAVARKSIVAVCDIAQGDLFQSDNIAVKRPGIGRSPLDYWDFLGSTARRSYRAGEAIDP